MRISRIVLAVCVLLSLGAGPIVREKSTRTEPPSLDGIVWAEQPVTYETLRGKTVVVLAYATWCPIANGWSRDLLRQLKAVADEKPIVVLAINAEKRKAADYKYMLERGFVGPNIFHGRDPTLPGRMGFQSDLFKYAVIDPQGHLVETGEAGTYFARQDKDHKEFVLPAQLAKTRDIGKFEILEPNMPERVSRVLWPLELGHLTSEAEIKAAKRNLTAEERQSLDTVIDHFLTARLEEIRKLAKGEMADKLAAYEKAAPLYTSFKHSDQAQEVKDLVMEFNQDPQFKRELAAKKAYDRAMVQVAKNPASRERLLKNVAKLFEGTAYGELAAGGDKSSDAKTSSRGKRTEPASEDTKTVTP